MIELGAPELIIEHEKVLLQENVDELLDNGRARKPSKAYDDRTFASLADLLVLRSKHDSVLRDRFLRRAVDYSARTRLTAGKTANIDTVFVPDRLAWDLVQPNVIGELRRTLAKPFTAWKLIRSRSPQAFARLETACARSLILVAVPSGPWRLFAVRVELTGELGLKVHPELLDRIGWENLGKPVNIFGVLTEEAEWDAAKLFPSRLQGLERPLLRRGDRLQSAFNENPAEVIEKLTRWVLKKNSFPLDESDRLLVGDMEWLSLKRQANRS
jgi:hypothetical protein